MAKTKTTVLRPMLINGVEMNRQYPETFEIPPDEVKAAQIVGKSVKIAIPGERFWVEITKVKYPILEGRVDNDLLTTQLKYNDIVRFHADNIISIYE